MIKIGICDDDENFLEIITYKIENCLKKEFNIDYQIFTFSSLESFIKYYESNKIDIIFFDIMINSKNIMNWSINRFQSDNIQIIFMTAYPQCAYNISETNCSYYLIKSRIDNTTLKKAFTRVFKNLSSSNHLYLTIKASNGYSTVKIDDILYIESLSNNIIIHIKNQGSIDAYTSLKKAQKKLPVNFLRCHHSYIVNMRHITGYRPYFFMLDSNSEIPIPVKKYKDIIQEYQEFIQNFKGEL